MSTASLSANSQIHSLIDLHLDDSPVFRNSVFHFQTDDRKRARFHDLNKFNWGQQSYVAFQRYLMALKNA